MTFETEVAQVIRSGLSLFILFLVIRCYLNQRLFIFRQRLFSIRNALFEHAANGVISFDHPAYRITRNRLNALIRFAHRINSIHLILLFFAFYRDSESKRHVREFEDRLKRACVGLSKEAKESIDRTQAEAMLAIFSYPFVFAMPFFVFRYFFRQLLRMRAQRVKMIGEDGVLTLMDEADTEMRLEAEKRGLALS